MSQNIHQKYHREFFEKFFSMLLNTLQSTLSGNSKVIDFKLPEKLKSIVNFDIGEQPTPPNQLLQQCKLIMQNQTKPYHPGFHNQLFGGFDEYSIIGNIMTTCMNGTMFTYQVAPCYTIMEQSIFQYLRQRIGWQTIDGMMTPGGSFANWNSLLLARYWKFPQSKRKGIQSLPKIKIFTSKSSHYSIDKGAILQGYGIQNVIKIKCNQFGEMLPQHLQQSILQCIQSGCVPLYVNATVGTSVAGCIDPVEKIGIICKKYGVWLHVDAALGGAFWMSQKLRSKIGNCTNVDSITWDPHKALVVPLQATFFLCKHLGLMQQSNSTKADYLFPKQRNSYNISLDTGDKSLQCGRVIDILKVWTYFKGNGWKQIARHIQLEYELAKYQQNLIIKNPQKWILIYPVFTINLSYYYVPEQMRQRQKTDQFYKQLSKITIEAKKHMIQQGKILIGYATNGKDDNYFWRNVMSNPFLSFEDAQNDLILIEKYCQKAYEILNKKQ